MFQKVLDTPISSVQTKVIYIQINLSLKKTLFKYFKDVLNSIVNRLLQISMNFKQYRERGARSGRASNSEVRGPGFDPHKRHRVVSLGKTN